MPIYEYLCSACDHRADILHGINDPGPHFCPSCGSEGTMQKRFAPPAILFKGSGWAKKDRAASSASKSPGSAGGSETASEGSAKDADPQAPPTTPPAAKGESPPPAGKGSSSAGSSD